MPCVVRFLSAVLLACASLLAAPAAYAVDSGDIVVVSSKGEVHITDERRRAQRCAPAACSNCPLRSARAATATSSCDREPPPSASAPRRCSNSRRSRNAARPSIASSSRAATRSTTSASAKDASCASKLPTSSESIKGTQFNVASQDEATTISLFEGLLEVRATDDSDVVDLKAGEIASRKRGDKSISIIRMDAGKAPPTSSRPSQGSGSNSGAPVAAPRVTPGSQGGESPVVDRGPISVRPDCWRQRRCAPRRIVGGDGRCSHRERGADSRGDHGSGGERRQHGRQCRRGHVRQPGQHR